MWRNSFVYFIEQISVDALAEKRPADPEPADETTDISQGCQILE